MTINEMVNRYTRSLSDNGSIYKGKTAHPIIPFLICDITYQERLAFEKRFKPEHQMKNWNKIWHHHYNMFNKPFFSCFPESSQYEITDLMDDLEHFMANDMTILKSKIMLLMDDVSFEDKQNVTSLLTCHIMEQFAQVAWGNCYKSVTITSAGRQKKRNENEHLKVMSKASFNMAVLYFKPLSTGSIMLSELSFDNTFKMIANHLYAWLEQTK